MGKEKWVHWMMMVLHLMAVVIFTRGFLLTRTELPNFSQCDDVSQSPCSFLNQSHHTHAPCWTKPAIRKLVIIIFDALRFDFVAPSTFFQEKRPWMNKLKLIQDLAATNASSARIFKAIADPPTTSLQRLKGLTTGGLPTFIDVGNSFGAPAIVEDNLLHQLAQNGKSVVMMGDDTWTQLFPKHFRQAFPYPSFNVRDLDTVDNGCIEHLLPFLHQDDWDVLIAHFLGLDHAGHIFGVDSPQMIEKLEQYNTVLQAMGSMLLLNNQGNASIYWHLLYTLPSILLTCSTFSRHIHANVVEALESQSAPGGRHENTILLVMGDHGQTVNGDHGGGTAEEVETSLFALSFKNPPSFIPAEFDTSSCGLDLDNRNICTSSLQQLDFAATISALLGIPFPFGSIGRVNPQLYALGGGTWNFDESMGNCQNQPKLDEWMLNYANVLCTNSWQVKRYIDIYSASSVIGFSHEDLLHIGNIYAKAEDRWLHTTKKLLHKKESCNELFPALKRQIEEYSTFLASVAELARSKWTEFNLKLMGTGLVIMFISLIIHFLAIKKVKEQYGFSFTSSGDSGISFGLIFACFLGVIRACSFLSNSFILEEGKVACFLLATTGFVKLRSSFMKKKMILEALVLLVLVTICRFAIQFGLSKQASSSEFVTAYPSWMLRITSLWNFVAEVLPVLALILLAFLLHKAITRSSPEGIWKYIIMGTGLSYILIAAHWVSESKLLNWAWVLEYVGRNSIPRLVYAIGVGQLLLLAVNQLFIKQRSSEGSKMLSIKAVAMFSVWSSTIIILLGKQGPFIALAFIIGGGGIGYCIMRLDNVELDGKDGGSWNLMLDPVPVTQWSLFAVCLFFCTGHWCAFDGLRYGAAFTGFDEFILVPQAILLTMDTYGFSLILPIFGLPFLVACRGQTEKGKQPILGRLSLVYMIYGLIMATSVTATIVCVTIHRRHLMVWGLFAPKFVFDVVGLILTDGFICLASLYYFSQMEDRALYDPSK